MCNVWKRSDADTLQPLAMRKLPTSLRTINLSGGEPFLREDLPQFVREIHARCPHAQITISTNAFLAERIETRMDEILRIDPTVRLAVSLDGIGEAHDRIRGVDGIFAKAMGLIESLQAKGYSGLRLSMTISSQNLDQVLQVADLADRLGVEMGVLAAHGAKTHLDVEPQDRSDMPAWLHRPFETLAARWLRSWRPRRWLRAHFAAYSYHYLAGRPWRYRCRAGEDFFFLQADGTVYHCSVQGRALGNIATDTWETIWRSPTADEARRAAQHCPEHCWMICTVRGLYRAHALRVLLWILLAKARAHLRLFHLKPFRKNTTDANTAH